MILIALGGNMPVENQSPVQTLRWAIDEMAKYQIYVMSISSFYCTKPVGQAGQSDYINAVVRVRVAMGPANLLKNLKMIEMAAGRGTQPVALRARWGPRPLDLDLVDYKKIVTGNFQVCSRYSMVTKVSRVSQLGRCELVLPHPQAHLRPFVIRPIIDIAPFWHHPVTGLSALSMWALIKNKPEGSIIHELP
ncbi:MAG: 2-amino-4-hydroxy-6-hydroxymethyldihydropteridine diphosphokinase [bacterium]|nr:2-amino-4-hydroxy-6-hydroxymethyldihydropteridine diphosphokinase [bacterium]